MHDYAGSDTFWATIPLIDDSDAPNASNFDAAPQALADRTTSLQAHKLTKDATDTITGAITISTPGELIFANATGIEFESGSGVIFDAGSSLEIAGHVLYDTGSTIGGPVTRTAGTETIADLGSISIETSSGLSIDVATGLALTVAGALTIGVAGAVKAHTSGAVTADVSAGVTASAAGGVSSSVDGGIEFAGGSTDFGKLSPARAKTYSFPIRLTNPNAIDGTSWAVPGNFLEGKAQSVFAIFPLENPHDGATLDSVTVTFAVTGTHSAVPANLPAITVQRFHLAPGSSYFLGEDLSVTSSQGPPTPASGSAWDNSHLTQSFTYTCDQNNVIDNASYVYVISLIDEHGTDSVAGNTYVGVTAAYSGITDLRFPS
jgi:hypothetical protein